MKWVRADMGFEPGVSGWEARTLSLCIAAPLHRKDASFSHLLVQWIFIVRHSMNQNFRWRIRTGDLQFKSTDPQPPELQHQLTSVNDEFHGRHLFIAATKDWRHRRSWTINLDANFYFCLSDKQFFAHSRKHEAFKSSFMLLQETKHSWKFRPISTCVWIHRKHDKDSKRFTE